MSTRNFLLSVFIAVWLIASIWAVWPFGAYAVVYFTAVYLFMVLIYMAITQGIYQLWPESLVSRFLKSRVTT